MLDISCNERRVSGGKKLSQISPTMQTPPSHNILWLDTWKLSRVCLSDSCWSYWRCDTADCIKRIFGFLALVYFPYMSHLVLYICEYLSSATLFDAHCPPWRKKKFSVRAQVEDREPGELWAAASRVEPLLAPGAFSLWWSLWNGPVAAERKKKAHLIFWTCSATLRPNSKRYSHKSHFFWLFQWTVSQIKMKLSPRLLDRSLF